MTESPRSVSPSTTTASQKPRLPFKPKHGSRIFDNSTTVVGAGTQGLGAKCHNSNQERIRLEYRNWARAKDEQRSNTNNNSNSNGGRVSNDNSPTRYLSPRDISERDRQAVEQARLLHEAHLKENAVAIAKERQQIKEMLIKRKAEEQKAVHHVINHKRQFDLSRRQTVLALHANEKEEQLQNQKDLDRENRDEWKKMLADEKQAEKDRIAHSKAVFKEMHDRSKQQIEADRAAKLQKIQTQKRAEQEKMNLWRNEQRQNAQDRHTETTTLRTNLNDGVQRSKMENEENKKSEVGDIKREFGVVKTLSEKRHHQREVQRLKRAHEAKLAAQTNFAEKMEEIYSEKKQAADEVRFISQQISVEKQQDQEERIRRAREMKEMNLGSARNRQHHLPPTSHNHRQDDGF